MVEFVEACGGLDFTLVVFRHKTDELLGLITFGHSVPFIIGLLRLLAGS